MTSLLITFKCYTMLRDQFTAYTIGTNLFASWEEVEQAVVSFVDNYLPDFIVYYKSQGSPTGENRITDLLSYHFNTCQQGYLPLFFGKNPSQEKGFRESDLGVYAKDRNMKPMLPIFEFEAKKLSPSSTSHEYVYGERGGMERFKREIHSPHLPHCGLLGYILCNNINHWSNKINTWITRLANLSPKEGLDWQGTDELLHFAEANGTIAKYVSKNKRITLSDIAIIHYLIDLQ